MGISILELVIRRLREENVLADVAYPGQKFPQIKDTAAAVHIQQVDREGMTVTLEVSIVCPAAMGGTACELEALRVTEILRWEGAVCIQNGCSYDGIAQVYVVQILATFTGITKADTCSIGPGFRVFLNNVYQMDAVSFQEEQVTERTQEYVMGQTFPVEVRTGETRWSIQLEEQIPTGTTEPEEPGDGFMMKVVTDQKTEVYSGCCWTSIQRKFARGGLHRIRKGFARSKEVS